MRLRLKRLVAALVCALMLAVPSLLLCSCKPQDDGGEKIVVTTFVLYDWVKEVLGEEAESYSIVILGANGADMHSYQPTVADIATLSTCEMFVHIGGESDEWVGPTLQSAQNEDMTRVDLSEKLEAFLCEREHEHEHGHGEEHEHSFDEHIWFSFDLVRRSVGSIAEALGERYPDKNEIFSENAREYTEKIDELEGEYKALGAQGGCVVVGDRYPFAYLFDSLGIEAHAAFEGCSAESEASFEVIARLSSVIDERGLGHILVCEDSDGRIADAIARNTKRGDAEILTLNSLQSLGKEDTQSGVGYISVMRENLEVLRCALAK